MHQRSHIGVPEGEEREKGPEKIFEEIIAENFPNMGKEIVNQVPGGINPRRNILRHTVIKLTKIKTKIKYEKQQRKNGNINGNSHKVKNLISQQKL